ncbi:MAG: flagellar hook-associated protein FlgL [Chloroflexi bacterium]|jgi:flagellar hook-associated protein 3 FlgL|nr:flagellar hook-associated protein FlgL [Chloroflexota bacterium]
MRVTTRMLTSQVASQIMANAEAMQQTQRQLTSGKRITRPGDDPAAAAAGVRLRAQQSRDAQYLRNIEHARTWLDTTDRVLSDIGDLLGRARELAVQASTGTFTSGDTKQLAEEINAIRSQIISAVNGTVDVDQHVFSGQKSDITPLVLDANGNASYQGDTGVTIGTGTGAGSDLAPANGIPNVDNGIVQIAAQSPVTSRGSYSIAVSAPVGGSVTVTLTRASDGKQEAQTVAVPASGKTSALEFSTVGINVVVGSGLTAIAGDNVFAVDGLGLGHEVAQGAVLETNISASAMLPMLAQLKTFYDALLSGTAVNSASNTAIGQIDVAVDRMLSLRAQVGAKTNHLDFAQARGEARDVENGRLISVNEDIDLTEALSRLTTQQTVYKASLEIGSRVMQNSLMDYLR